MLPILSFIPHSDFEESLCAYIASNWESDVRFLVDFNMGQIAIIGPLPDGGSDVYAIIKL